MPMVYKRPESVLVLVYTQIGEVLLLERADRSGYWQSVTGALEWEESPAAAAERELWEETGLRAAPIDCHIVNRFAIWPAARQGYAPESDQNLEHLFRLCLPARTEIRLNPHEHLHYAWYPASEAAEKVFSWTNREAIVEYVPFL